MAAARGIDTANTVSSQEGPGAMSAAPLHDENPNAFAGQLRATAGLGVDGHRAVDDLLAMVEREKAFNDAYPKDCYVFAGARDHIERIRGGFFADKLAALFELGARLKAEHGAHI